MPDPINLSQESMEQLSSMNSRKTGEEVARVLNPTFYRLEEKIDANTDALNVIALKVGADGRESRWKKAGRVALRMGETALVVTGVLVAKRALFGPTVVKPELEAAPNVE